jgi:hypothetical protein
LAKQRTQRLCSLPYAECIKLLGESAETSEDHPDSERQQSETETQCHDPQRDILLGLLDNTDHCILVQDGGDEVVRGSNLPDIKG